MNQEQFDVILQRRLDKMKLVLGRKGKEYSGSQGDRLHNFKQAAMISPHSCGETPAEVLLGFMRKHIVSVMDLIVASKHGKIVGTDAVDEKCGGIINYLVLLEAIFTEEDEKLLMKFKEKSDKVAGALFGKEGYKGEREFINTLIATNKGDDFTVLIPNTPAGTIIDENFLKEANCHPIGRQYQGPPRDAAGICTCSIHNT